MNDKIIVAREDPEPVKRGSPRHYPLDTMEPGERFFIPHKTVAQVASNISTQGQKLGRTFTTRTETRRWDGKTKDWVRCPLSHDAAVVGVGVYRVEDK